MIPTIEQIVEDLLAGSITKQQAIAWLYQHAEDAGRDLRDEFAAKAMQGMVCADADNGRFRDDATAQRTAEYAYRVADAMLAHRSKV